MTKKEIQHISRSSKGYVKYVNITSPRRPSLLNGSRDAANPPPMSISFGW
ncbi:MAG: hypothetical protein ACXAC8_11530 [Candidatus Hodarchaeales archaeon]